MASLVPNNNNNNNDNDNNEKSKINKDFPTTWRYQTGTQVTCYVGFLKAWCQGVIIKTNIVLRDDEHMVLAKEEPELGQTGQNKEPIPYRLYLNGNVQYAGSRNPIYGEATIDYKEDMRGSLMYAPVDAKECVREYTITELSNNRKENQQHLKGTVLLDDLFGFIGKLHFMLYLYLDTVSFVRLSQTSHSFQVSLFNILDLKFPALVIAGGLRVETQDREIEILGDVKVLRQSRLNSTLFTHRLGRKVKDAAWYNLPKMPTPRFAAAVCTLPVGDIFVVGGINKLGLQHNMHDGYLTKVNAFANPAVYAESCRLDNRPDYEMGDHDGFQGTGVRYEGRYTQQGEPCNIVEMFSVNDNQWHLLPPLPMKIAGAQLEFQNNKLYLIGGSCKVKKGEDNRSFAFSEIVLVYDMDVNIWKIGPSMNECRTEFGSVSTEDGILVVGGTNRYLYPNRALTAEYLSFHTMKWTLIDPPKGREMEERKDSDGKITEEAWERVLHPERIQCRCTFVDPSNCNNKRYVAIVSGMALDNSNTWTNPSQAAVCRVKNSRGGRSKDYVKKKRGDDDYDEDYDSDNSDMNGGERRSICNGRGFDYWAMMPGDLRGRPMRLERVNKVAVIDLKGGLISGNNSNNNSSSSSPTWAKAVHDGNTIGMECPRFSRFPGTSGWAFGAHGGKVLVCGSGDGEYWPHASYFSHDTCPASMAIKLFDPSTGELAARLADCTLPTGSIDRGLFTASAGVTTLAPGLMMSLIGKHKHTLAWKTNEQIEYTEIRNKWRCATCKRKGKNYVDCLILGEIVGGAVNIKQQKPVAGGVKLMTCIRCKAVSYCSKKCQKKDWKRHKKEDCKNTINGPTIKKQKRNTY